MYKRILVLGVMVMTAKGELRVGVAEVSITPEEPVSLSGQFYQRISKGVENPCTASVLAFEYLKDGEALDQAIMISLDVVSIPAKVLREFREFVADKLPGFDVEKLFMSATHTHTGPTLSQGSFADYGDALLPDDYLPFLYSRLSEAVVKAWRGRKPGAVAWGLGHAVVGQNRRAAYANGSAQMYGKVDVPHFIGLEGWEDHAVDILYFADSAGKLIGAAIIVPCPAQVVESERVVSADYWGNVRAEIKAGHGEDMVVAGFAGPAGDVVPRPMLRRKSERRMEMLRAAAAGREGESERFARKREVARRIVVAFEDVWSVVKRDLRDDVRFAHNVERFELPKREITEKEAASARESIDKLKRQAESETDEAKKNTALKRAGWHQRVVDMFESQKEGLETTSIEMHVLRFDDLVIATNPFELFQDYAMSIHGRSAATQTVLIQLTSALDRASYLPSARAAAGGGYSAVPQSTPVGPVGGRMLVDKTVEAIGAILSAP